MFFFTKCTTDGLDYGKYRIPADLLGELVEVGDPLYEDDGYSPEQNTGRPQTVGELSLHRNLLNTHHNTSQDTTTHDAANQGRVRSWQEQQQTIVH